MILQSDLKLHNSKVLYLRSGDNVPPQLSHEADIVIVNVNKVPYIIKNRFGNVSIIPEKEELITKHICLKSDLGICNNLFGGKLLSWVDLASAIFVAELLETTSIVTAHVSEASFRKPVKEGNIVHLYGVVKKVGNTSITLNIIARRKDVNNGTFDEVLDTEMVFVKVDDNGAKISIPQNIKDKISSIYL